MRQRITTPDRRIHLLVVRRLEHRRRIQTLRRTLGHIVLDRIDPHRQIGNLQDALVSRAVIDQAMGIIISRTGGTAGEAFDRLRTVSQMEHIKVSVVAAGIVEAAVRRAKIRTGSPAR